MVRVVDKIKGFTALLFMVLTFATAIPPSVFAAAKNPSYCDSSIDRLTNLNIGTEVPAILVHGFLGSTSEWGSLDNATSFAARINDIPGVAVGDIFSYKTNKWVDDADNGPKLAKTIDCLSRMSLQNGGKGKVVVVGYSMGGLLTRQALSYRSTDNQRAIADEVGQAITIGTPNTGALVPITKFRIGSNALEVLPHFPPQTIVHAIAGDVTRVYYDLFSQEVRREHPNDDTLVPISSALAEYTGNVSIGGGSQVISCEKIYSSITNISTDNAPCEHTQLTYATNGVRLDTTEAIKKYVAFLSTPAPDPTSKTLTIGALTTKYDNRWLNADYGASGPGEDLNADDTTNVASCTNCSDTPPPSVPAFIQVINMSWCTASIESCALDSQTVVGTAPAETIGGRTPSYSARYLDSGYDGTGLVWCFESDKICVYYRRGTDTPQLEPSQALLDVFSTATWSN